MGTIGESQMRRRGHFTQTGAGLPQGEMPPDQYAVVDDFTRGYSTERVAEVTEPGLSPYMMDVEVDKAGRLMRAVGISLTETLVRVPQAMFLHPNLDDAIDVVLISAPHMGVRQLGVTNWYDVALPSSALWVSALHAGTLVFSNNSDETYAREYNSTTIISLGWGPAAALVSFAGRLWAGNTEIGGVRNPIGVKWTGSSGEFDDVSGLGSGFELLLDDSTENDRIVAMKSLGFAMMVIVLRKAIWIGRPTGDEIRPVDFEPRISGVGAINHATVQVTPMGVVMLSDDGVKLFDGNSVQHMSAEIDDELLPLSYLLTTRYSAVYAPQTQIYTLFTDVATFDYSFVRRRWTRRSLIADRAVAIHNPLSFNYTTGNAGWGMSWGSWWGVAPPEGPGASNEVMIYQQGVKLGAPNEAVESYFDEPQTPVWQSPERDAAALNNLASVKRIDIAYKGDGAELLIETPDNDGNYQAYAPATLLPTTTTKTLSIHALRTGLGMGVRVTIVSGFPLIERLGAKVVVRSERHA